MAEESPPRKTIEENGITVHLEMNHDNPGKAKTFYNPRMKISREMALVAMAACAEEYDTERKCLDAFGATGILGLQWLKHGPKNLRVTLNDMDPVCVENIKLNCRKNGFKVYGEDSAEHDGSTAEVTCSDANVLLHQRQFHFVNIDPFGCTVQFLDATFRNVYHRGIIILTSTDVSSLYGKCSQVTERNYNAYTCKVDYFKEAAARIVLGVAARAAARCNKGFDVLYTVSQEHFISVAVRINRGPPKADASLAKVQRVLHCQMCDERVFFPESHTPIDTPYDALPCSCHSNTPGKTAILLGPLWTGSLFKSSFLRRMFKKAQAFRLSERACNLIATLLLESDCSGKDDDLECDLDTNHEKTGTVTKFKDGGVSNMKVKVSKQFDGDSESQNGGCSVSKRNSSNTEESSDVENGTGLKRKIFEVDGEGSSQSNAKKPTPTIAAWEIEKNDPDTLPFYYCPYRRKIKGVDMPKCYKMVKILQSEGYRASRTHFDTQAVRTNATMEQFKVALIKHSTTSS